MAELPGGLWAAACYARGRSRTHHSSVGEFTSRLSGSARNSHPALACLPNSLPNRSTNGEPQRKRKQRVGDTVETLQRSPDDGIGRRAGWHRSGGTAHAITSSNYLMPTWHCLARCQLEGNKATNGKVLGKSG